MEIISTEYQDPIENERYYLRDLEINDDEGKVIATICFSTVHPGQQTRGHIDTHNELYVFLDGRGVMMIDRELYGFDTTPRKPFRAFVKKGQFHKVLNNSAIPLQFVSVVPGKVIRMPYQNPPAEVAPDPLGSKQD